MKELQVEDYFTQIVQDKPEVVRAFAAFFLPELIKPSFTNAVDTKNYKSTASLGFVRNKGVEDLKAFCDGIEVLMGRQIENRESLLADNISMLGMALGIRDAGIQEHSVWFQRMMRQKSSLSSEQAIHADFLVAIVEKDIVKFAGNSFEEELLTIVSAITAEGSNNQGWRKHALEFYTKLHQKKFPYSDEFYLNVLAQNVYSCILTTYCLDDLTMCVRKADQYDKAFNRVFRIADLLAVVWLVALSLGSFAFAVLIIRDHGLWNAAQPFISISGLGGLPFGFAGLFILFFKRTKVCTSPVHKFMVKLLRLNLNV